MHGIDGRGLMEEECILGLENRGWVGGDRDLEVRERIWERRGRWYPVISNLCGVIIVGFYPVQACI